LARNGGVITSTPPPPARNTLPEASSQRLRLSSQVTQSRNVENRSVEPSAFSCARKASWQASDVKKGGGLARQLAEYVEEIGAANGKSDEWVPPVTRTWPELSTVIPVTVSWPDPPRKVEYTNWPDASGLVTKVAGLDGRPSSQLPSWKTGCRALCSGKSLDSVMPAM